MQVIYRCNVVSVEGGEGDSPSMEDKCLFTYVRKARMLPFLLCATNLRAPDRFSWPYVRFMCAAGVTVLAGRTDCGCVFQWHVPPGCTVKGTASPAYTVQSPHTRRNFLSKLSAHLVSISEGIFSSRRSMALLMFDFY